MPHSASLCRFLIACLMLSGSMSVRADDGPPRFRLLTESEMTPAQRELAQNIRSGPRASVAGSAANASATSLGSPFNVFLRSPELGEHLQRTGAYIRFKSVLGSKLTELHQNKKVSDSAFEAVKQRFGEQGVMDLIAVNGYYVLVAMVLNVDRTPIPGGAPLPLPVLK